MFYKIRFEIFLRNSKVKEKDVGQNCMKKWKGLIWRHQEYKTSSLLPQNNSCIENTTNHLPTATARKVSLSLHGPTGGRDGYVIQATQYAAEGGRQAGTLHECTGRAEPRRADRQTLATPWRAMPDHTVVLRHAGIDHALPSVLCLWHTGRVWRSLLSDPARRTALVAHNKTGVYGQSTRIACWNVHSVGRVAICRYTATDVSPSQQQHHLLVWVERAKMKSGRCGLIKNSTESTFKKNVQPSNNIIRTKHSFYLLESIFMYNIFNL